MMAALKRRQLVSDRGHAVNKVVIDVLYSFPLDPSLEDDPAIVMQKMELIWKILNDKFLNREKSLGVDGHATEYLILASRLMVIAEQRLYEIAADKVKYARHPSFPT